MKSLQATFEKETLTGRLAHEGSGDLSWAYLVAVAVTPELRPRLRRIERAIEDQARLKSAS